jgi:hypothetical protein
VDWLADFKPTGIEKYGGKTDPESWLTIYTLAIRATGEDSKAMANYLPVALTDSVRSWPLGLRYQFVANFQGTYVRPGIQFDVYHVIQQKNELLKDYILSTVDTRRLDKWGTGVRWYKDLHDTTSKQTRDKDYTGSGPS